METRVRIPYRLQKKFFKFFYLGIYSYISDIKKKEMTNYEKVQRVLAKLEKEGKVSSRIVNGKKFYSLTDRGKLISKLSGIKN